MRVKRKWETIFDAVPDPIVLVGLHYELLRVDWAMVFRLGTRPGDLIGRKCHEVVHGPPSPPDFCPMSLLIADRREHFAEIEEKNFNGIFQISVSPFFDDQDNFAGGIHVAHDITRQKTIEKALRESNENLEHRMTACTIELVGKAKDIEESNMALKVLMKHREQDRADIPVVRNQ